MRFKVLEWVVTVLLFIVVLYLYTIYSFFGIKDFVQDGVLKEYFDTSIWHIEVIASGTLFGTLFILINHLTEKRIFRRRSFGFNILLKSLLYIVALGVVSSIVFISFLQVGFITRELLKEFFSYLSPMFFVSVILYYSSAVLLINFVLYINRKFGSRTFFNLLIGKYYHPRDEELIFMFLDLKGSTALAEKLGHHDYSRFIKECVHELTPIIQKHQAQVYQYVGDEVILFWQTKDGIKKLNCLKAFFEFRLILKRRQEHFKTKYGEAPQFKAGMDAGVITMTEIGDIKREIAFHGDVLNTAARLEKKCNEFSEVLIISEHVLDLIDKKDTFEFRFLSDMPLLGKTENLKFYGVNSI